MSTGWILLQAIAASTVCAAGPNVAGNWPHWRGPAGNGVSQETSLPGN